MWSLAKAMDYGWLFRTPVFGRWGNGYIYDEEFLTPEQAKAEVEQVLGHEITIGQHIKFDPGALDQAWIKNCCAIGLSASFVEPLEASSIGTSIQQTFLLMYKLSNYNEYTIEDYNKSVTDIMENIRDFIVLHYVTKKTNTDFWKDINKIELPDSLQSKLNRWQHRLPIPEDFSSVSNYVLFTPDNFIVVMEGLDLFDRKSIADEYNSLYPAIKKNADFIINQQMTDEYRIKFITHKEMISIIRDYL